MPGERQDSPLLRSGGHVSDSINKNNISLLFEINPYWMQEIKNFPFLSNEEFAAACAAFVNSAETTGKKAWEEASLDTRHEVAYLSIVKHIHVHDQSAALSDSLTDKEYIDDDDDQEVLSPPQAKAIDGRVVFDTVLSASYRVPVLYFTLRKADGSTVQSLEAVYASLVPSHMRESVHAVGALGGISMTDHPLTGRPAFFVHPCLTPGAMRVVAGHRAVRTEDYIRLWLGLVGSAVGLHAPIPV